MAIKARQDIVKTFGVDYVSPHDDERYAGNFTTRKLTVRDRAQLGVRKTQLNGGMHHDDAHPGQGIDDETDSFNNMIAHLELSIKDSPAWWNMDQISDVGLLVTVFKEVLDFEQSFLRRQADRAAAGSAGKVSGSTNPQEANTGGAVSAVVGKEVQSSLEP